MESLLLDVRMVRRTLVLVSAGFWIGHATVGNAADPNVVFTPGNLMPVGDYYQATVPDTLDLAERARIAVGGLTRFLNHGGDCEPYGQAYFYCQPAYMSQIEGSPGRPNWGKIADALILTRRMCGSDENLDIQARSLRAMIDYMPIDAQGPTPATRAMLALIHLHQDRPHSQVREIIERFARGHREVAQFKDDYAFYQDAPLDDEDPSIGLHGYWMQPFIQGTAARVLTVWHQAGGDDPSLDMARRLVNFVTRPKYWQPECEPRAVSSPDRAHFMGHTHAFTSGLMGILWYADAVNDQRLKEFVRSGYEYLRNFGLARLGVFGEGCTTGDMTMLALKLSEVGVGDYWDDADSYVRNHLSELQLTAENAEYLRKLNDTLSPCPKELDPQYETKDNIVDRNIGCFMSDSSQPSVIGHLLWTICCTGNCMAALHYAWEATVRGDNGHAKVNLLLNRASPWLDVDSHLPYKGKVILRNKSARAVSVRVPLWVAMKEVKSEITRANGKENTSERPLAVGRYLTFTNLGAGDVIQITFPVKVSRESYTLKWKEDEFWKESTHPGKQWVADNPVRYTMEFRGNTLVALSPRSGRSGLPLYQRDHLKESRVAPMKTVTRFVGKQ